MDREEYEKFMAYLFNEYVRGRRSRLRHRLHPELEYDWIWEWESLRKAAHTIRHITRFCDDEDDIYRTFTPELLERLPNEVLGGVRWNNRLAHDAGFLDAFDAHYGEIIEGMKLEDMPVQELEVLRELGSEDPESELTALIYMVKARGRAMREHDQEVRVSKRLKEIEEKLEYQCKKLDELKESSEEPPKKSKRWFKGLGQIAQGSALSIANVGLLIGALPILVAAETATWGALVSSVTGVGMVISGIGEFRGE